MWNDKVAGSRCHLRDKEYKSNDQRVEVFPMKDRSELQDADVNATRMLRHPRSRQDPAKSDPSVLYQMVDLTSFNQFRPLFHSSNSHKW